MLNVENSGRIQSSDQTRFPAALLESHVVATRAELWVPDPPSNQGRAVTSSYLGNVLVAGGSVTVDRTAQFRRSFTGLQVIVPYPDLVGTEFPADSVPIPGVGGGDFIDNWQQYIPTTAGDNFAPHGTELALFRGIAYGPPDYALEYAPLGIFTISCTDVAFTGQGLLLTLDGYDRSRRISRATLTHAQLYLAGATVHDAINTLITRQCGINVAYGGWWGGGTQETGGNFLCTPGGPNDDASSHGLPPLYYQVNDDPWQESCSLATVTGSELFVNGYGDTVLQVIPTSSSVSPVAVYQSAEDTDDPLSMSPGSLLSVDPKWDDQYVVNTWIVQCGGSTVTRFTGVARDVNPNSPTNVFKYGEISQQIQSSLISTQPMANAMARGLLMMHTGIVNSIQFGLIPDPRLEPGDVIQIEYPRAGTSGLHVIESLSIPMDAATAMTGTTREVASL